MLATAVWMVGRAMRSPSWHPVPVTRRNFDSAVDPCQIALPASILPSDGRFVCGPSKVRAGQIDAIVAGARDLIGTSHRKPPVKNLVGSIRAGLRELFALPEGWEIMLGNGGTTVFWDAASFALVDRRSQHLAFGEFSTKFAEVCRAAPHLDEPAIITSPAGDHPDPVGEAGVDLYALTHNETSTGVAMQLRRPSGSDTGSLVAVDATSAAGGLRWDTEEIDVYYFAPQKCFASDGGLWIAACAPAAIERIDRLTSGQRWIPASIDLGIALIGLWLFSQLDPSLPLFGIVFFSDGVQAQLAGIVGGDARRLLGPISVAMNLVSLGLLLTLVMRSKRAALAAVALLVWIAALTKLIAASLLLRSEAAFLWVSKEVAWAIVAGMLFVGAAAALPRPLIRVLCALSLLCAIGLSVLRPGEAQSFLSLRLFRWNDLQLMHYTGLSATVAEVWPYAALFYLLLLWRRDRTSSQARPRPGLPL